MTIMGIIDIVRYWAGINHGDTGLFMRLGLMLLIFIMGFYVISELISLARISRKAELMKKLAYSDALTGLNNRMAFDETEKNLKENKPKTDICIVQFDINNLKTANDTYGHKVGDSHIIAGANAILNSFGKIGDCFRTGGDEFIAVVNCADNSNKLKLAEKRLAEEISRYNSENNPTVSLSIAYGIAQIDGNDPAAAERTADARMYEMKKKMKAAAKLSAGEIK